MVKDTKTGLYIPRHAKHHSASDWDFSSTDWTIATDQYISPPSSFKIPTLNEAGSVHLLCKNAATLQVKFGRLITYHRFTEGSATFYMDFRNTAAPGTVNFANCYQVRFNPVGGTWTLDEYLADVKQRTWSRSKISLSPDTWHRYRLTWWWEWDVLNVRFDIWLEGEWQQQGDIINIPNDLFGDETYQRVGLGPTTFYFYYFAWLDDTQIWEI